MTKYLKYLYYIIRHKYFVGIECWKRGLFYRGIFHDISKLLPGEFIPYAKWFYGETNKRDIINYDIAWLKHQHRNPHHWQYWMLQNDNDGMHTLQMPNKYAIEMVCDWLGAEKSINGRQFSLDNTRIWYLFHKNNITLHPTTRAQVRKLLKIIFPYSKAAADKQENIKITEKNVNEENIEKANINEGVYSNADTYR